MSYIRWNFEILTTEASNIIGQGDLHCPDLSFGVLEAIFGQKLEKLTFSGSETREFEFRPRKIWLWSAKTKFFDKAPSSFKCFIIFYRENWFKKMCNTQMQSEDLVFEKIVKDNPRQV